MSKLVLRTITGLIFVAVVVAGTLYTEWTKIALWALLGLLCAVELCQLLTKSDLKSKYSLLLVGIVYISLPVAVVVLDMQPMVVITVLSIVWINDTGAYLVGSAIGKHKMAPKVSPKKSWEGFFGGMAFAIGASLVWYALYWKEMIYGSGEALVADKIYWAVFGAMIAVAAVVGDLLESALKRAVGAKDSGKMLPGHGGMLDRMDASLLALPVAWLLLRILIS